VIGDLRIQTVQLPKKPNDSPHDLHISLRVGPFARPASCIRSRRNRRLTQAPLMRFLPPPALKPKASTLPQPTPKCPRCCRRSDHIHPHRSASPQEPRALPARCVPPTPFQRPRRVAPLTTVPSFPGATLMGFLSYRVSPDSGGPARYRTGRPLMTFSGLRFATGFASDCCARPPSTSGCLSEADRRRSPPVSRR